MPKYRELWKVYQDVFDIFTIRALDKIVNSGYLKDLVSPISQGKEAWVFIGEDKTGERVAVKIYKMMIKDYKSLYKYLIQDPRFYKVGRTRVEIILAWVKKEYKNLNKMYMNEVSVPMPITFYKNILVMEFIGKKDPAPLLKDSYPKDPKTFWKKLYKNLKNMIEKAKLVHGDLSEYNILNFEEKPIIIDVSQAIPVGSPNSIDYLKRDIKNLKNFFSKFNIDISKDLSDLLSTLTSISKF